MLYMPHNLVFFSGFSGECFPSELVGVRLRCSGVPLTGDCINGVLTALKTSMGVLLICSDRFVYNDVRLLFLILQSRCLEENENKGKGKIVRKFRFKTRR